MSSILFFKVNRTSVMNRNNFYVQQVSSRRLGTPELRILAPDHAEAGPTSDFPFLMYYASSPQRFSL